MTQYRDAFAELWDNVLLTIPTGITDIAKTLERTYVIRRFNRDALAMGQASGTVLNHIIGIGTRPDPDSGKMEPVTYFYPSHYREVVECFAHFPLASKFGLSISEAMALPLDQWFHVRKVAERVASQEQPDTMPVLIEILKGMVSLKGGEE